jgi:hypothetical protein
VVLLNYFVKIIYRGYLVITSIVGTSSLPKLTTRLLPVATVTMTANNESVKGWIASIHRAAEKRLLGNSGGFESIKKGRGYHTPALRERVGFVRSGTTTT